MPAKVAATTTAIEKSVREFRKQSVNLGVPVNLDVLRQTSLKGTTSKLGVADFEAFVDAYLDVVQVCHGENLDTSVEQFCDENLPTEGSDITQEILMVMAGKIKPAMKLSRVGLGSRIMLSLVLTYMDLITDLFVTKEYSEGGSSTRKFFHISIGIIITQTLCNIIISLIANSNKSLPSKSLGVLIALIQLNPLAHGLKVWRGVATSVDDVLQPFHVFIMVRVVELIFEVMPGMALQLYGIYHATHISNTVVFSVLSSVASASFIMTDNGIMYERGEMSKQKRGPYSHPLFGFIPTTNTYRATMQAGSLLFYGGYLACAMVTLSAVLAVFRWEHVPLFMACEFGVYLLARSTRGELVFVLEPPGGWVLSGIIHFLYYMMMCLAPWTQLRDDDGALGGSHYAAIIVYKLVSYTGATVYAAGKFADGDEEVTMKAGTVRFIFGIALGVTVTGAAVGLGSVTETRRWTFYGSRQTGPEWFKWLFEADTLVGEADTKDQQRVWAWLFAHPRYLDRDKVKEWLLGLKSDGDILGRGDKKLPKGYVWGHPPLVMFGFKRRTHTCCLARKTFPR